RQPLGLLPGLAAREDPARDAEPRGARRSGAGASMAPPRGGAAFPLELRVDSPARAARLPQRDARAADGRALRDAGGPRAAAARRSVAAASMGRDEARPRHHRAARR